jgi:hypoxanthine phosphoribosyltransferase
MPKEPVKLYITSDEIHNLVHSTTDQLSSFDPEVIIVIGRYMKEALNIPLYTVSIKMYSETDQLEQTPKILQWLDERGQNQIKGKRVLIVDEIDDTRSTLAFCVNEMLKEDISGVAVYVLHNKLAPKKAEIQESVPYFFGIELPNVWIVYPWESKDIKQHNKLAYTDNKQLVEQFELNTLEKLLDTCDWLKGGTL